tara:strand:- start:629 stop:901 length:273 start_codon:yes stop_codon:yes gene_type:complete
MSKAQRSEELASTGMGLVNGIILHHIATCIPKAVALNGKEMQLAMDKSEHQSNSWAMMCDSIESRIGLSVMDGNWDLDKIVLGGVVNPLH